MALPDITMRQLLEAGVHFGHQTHRWNPKMAPYIYGSRNNIHIIDLTQTVPLLHQALVTVSRRRRQRRPRAVRRHQAAGVRGRRRGRQVLRAILRQSPLARRHADQLAHHLQLDQAAASRSRSCWPATDHGLTKKELLQLTREKDKLERSLGGIKDMGALPDLMFVIDTNKESIAIAEARKLHMPVVAVVDSNCDPGWHQSSHSRQRRRRSRHHALLRPDRRAPPSTASSGRRAPWAWISAPPRSPWPIPRSRATKTASARPPTAARRRSRREPMAEVRAEVARGPMANGRRASLGVHPTPKAPRLETKVRCDGDNFGNHGEGPAREDRRGHDGLQGGACRDQGRRRGRGRLAQDQGSRQGRQEGRPRRRGRSDRSCGRRRNRRRWSRSTPRRISSPATRPSRRWRPASPRLRSGRRRCRQAATAKFPGGSARSPTPSRRWSARSART